MPGTDPATGWPSPTAGYSPAQGQQFVQQNAPAGVQPYIRNQQQFTNQAFTAGGGRLGRLARLRSQENALGYNNAQNTLQSYDTSQLTNPTVDFKQGEDPTLGQLSQYVSQRLGVGLTPEETAAIRGRGLESIGGAQAEANRSAGSRLQALGVDPRSGIGMAQAGQVQRQGEQEKAGLQRDITLADLARKGEIEQLAANVSSQQEGARQFDVGAQQRQQMAAQGSLAGLAGLSEQGKEYDTNYLEGLRQAQMSRKAWERAGKALEPSTLEQVGGALNSLGQGMLGGGGGGGGI